MKSLVHFAFLFSLMASCMSVGAISRGKSYMPLPSQERKSQDADEGRVYTAKEVDAKAKFTNKMEHIPEVGRDCPREGLVRLRIVLHKSGRVTEVTIIKGMGCSFDEAAVEAACKLKFTPAVRAGESVSQYQIFEYGYQ